LSTETVEPDAPEPAVPPQPDAAPAVPAQAPEPAAESVPAETVAVEAAAAEADLLESPEPAAPKRRLSTPALLVAAALLGPVIGAGVGYAVQASRKPTPLPEVVTVQLSYPAARVDPQALADAGPKPLNIEGDLTELLLKRPDGTEEWHINGGGDGWIDAADIAETVGNSDKMFRQLLNSGFRRGAVVGWKSGQTEVRIRLVQYRPDSTTSADNFVALAGGASTPIPGVRQSRVLIGNKAQHYAESTEEFWFGTAVARKGDLVMEVEIHAPSKVDRGQLEDIAKRQWERIA